MMESLGGSDGDGVWARLRRALARAVAAAFVAWALAEASRRGICGEGGCGLLDAARSDLIGVVAAAIDLALQCVFAGGKCGFGGRRPPDDEDDGGGAAVGGGSRRGGRRRIRLPARRGRAAKAAAPAGIDGAVGGRTRATETPAARGGAARRMALAEWVARVRRSAEC